MKATQQQYEEAVKLYDEGSIGDVYAYAEKLGIDEWSECVLCDAITPDCHDGACFVCGSPKITAPPNKAASTYSVVTSEEAGVLKALRHKGYAVVIFDPEELQGVKPRSVEDALVTEAWVIIDALKD